MGSIIDNTDRTVLETLRNSLDQAERIDIMAAFFYFSGFNELANELKDKKIRILVGTSIDPETINDLSVAIRENKNVMLEPYEGIKYHRLNNLQKKQRYIDSFIGLFNKSSLSEEFDGTDSQRIFRMFLEKLNGGTLEIRLTKEPNHAKFYVLTNKPEYSCNGDQKGVVIMGSSNFTYNGLCGQGEMNIRLSDNDKYEEHLQKFEKEWNDSGVIDIFTENSNREFTDELNKKLWIFAKPSPYNIFIRILFELYYSIEYNDIKNPSEISNGKFSNLKYQIDAVKQGIECLSKNNGVIIADVVGLGKSIIASAIARNLDIDRTVIISPPHLMEQWDGYQQDFGLRGAKVYSSGKVEELHKSLAAHPHPILYIIDEAHRYRNELSSTYQYLHQLTRSHPDNKIILLTATPYNNRPHDIFALIKLFQTPNCSTINSVDNIGVRFRELIAQYNSIKDEGKRNLTESIRLEFEEISKQLRLLINPVIIRRSRIDLVEIKEYAEDLKRQNIVFPEVVGPELIEYDLGEIRNLYVSTLEQLSEEFICARYNPSKYLIDAPAFMREYGELFEETDIQLFQRNLAYLIKRLLVTRFESSKAAFKTTLDSILLSYENIKLWWAKGYVPIQKRGYLQNPDDSEIEETLREINDISNEPLDIKKIKRRAIPIPKELFENDFINAIESDICILSKIRKNWFIGEETGFDPKFERVRSQIDTLLEENNNWKIVVFTYYADTAEYVASLLKHCGYRTFLYTGDSKKTDRNIVRENFDASHDGKKQKDEYDIIVATDALSEGFNLNRAGVIINYDIPYNPTRVVQRIGRINRVNKKMFDKIYVFNLFPTDIGEETTLIRGISTLKMLLINNIVGSDTKTLTADETLQSYFKRQYNDANIDSKERSWDNEYRNIFNSIKHDEKLLKKVMEIPERVRIIRKNDEDNIAISFAKRGENSLFAIAHSGAENAEIVSPEIVLPLFKALPEEEGYVLDDELEKKFIILRNEITKPYLKRNLDSRRGKAIDTLEKLLMVCPSEKDYFNDLREVIKSYDDLSDGELKYLANLAVNVNKKKEIVEELKQRIPNHYIIRIKEKAERIDAKTETIMFTEDLRNDEK